MFRRCVCKYTYIHRRVCVRACVRASVCTYCVFVCVCVCVCVCVYRDLEARRQQIWHKTRTYMIGESLRCWGAAARQMREERQTVAAGQRWQRRVVASALRFWRQRVAWWAHTSVLNRCVRKRERERERGVRGMCTHTHTHTLSCILCCE